MRTLRTTLRGAAVAAVAASLAAGAAVAALPATAAPSGTDEGRATAKTSVTTEGATSATGERKATKPKVKKPKKAAADPDFGPNVTFIDPSWSTDRINTFLDSVNDEEEMSLGRHQVFFEPGDGHRHRQPDRRVLRVDLGPRCAAGGRADQRRPARGARRRLPGAAVGVRRPRLAEPLLAVDVEHGDQPDPAPRR
jgi:hypothetical protein